MALSAAELRAKIASGEIKRREAQGAGPGAGIFGVQFDSAEFGPGESGNVRGKIKCRVIEAANPSDVGKTFNYFIQTVHSGYLESTLAEFAEYAKVWGIPEERIYDRAETPEDIVFNLMGEMQRMAIKGLLLGVIERKDQGKLSAKGKPLYWNNIQSVSLNAASTPAPAPAAPAPAPAPASAAPAASATRPKPWKK